MKRIIAVACLLSAFAASAVTVRREALPPSPWADTEISTNVPFAAHEKLGSLKDFVIGLSLHATPSNNVEVSFGRDADSDGSLSVGEIDFTLAWECGCWVVDKEFKLSPATADAEKSLSWKVLMNGGKPVGISAEENGIAIPTASFLQSAADFYKPGWNLMRITRRGVDAAHESFEITAVPQGFVLRFR